MEKFEITEQWFNNICEDILNRFLLSMNDGQGDNCVYTYNGTI